jgi:hypothetical protein
MKIRTRIVAVLLGIVALLGVLALPAYALDPAHYITRSQAFDNAQDPDNCSTGKFGDINLGVYYSEHQRPGYFILDTRPYVNDGANIFIWSDFSCSLPAPYDYYYYLPYQVRFEVQWIRYYDSAGHQWGETVPIRTAACKNAEAYWLKHQTSGESLRILEFTTKSNGGIYERKYPGCWKNSISLQGYATWTNPASGDVPRIGVYLKCIEPYAVTPRYCAGLTDGISRSMPAF